MIDETYYPTESHSTLYKKIRAWMNDGYSLGRIGEMLLPNRTSSSARNIIWRASRNDWPHDNEVRMELGLPIIIEIQDKPGTLHEVPADHVYNPATHALKRKAPRNPQAKRTPGGWVNAKDPQRAARQIVGRAEYGIGELIEWLEIELRKNMLELF